MIMIMVTRVVGFAIFLRSLVQIRLQGPVLETFDQTDQGLQSREGVGGGGRGEHVLPNIFRIIKS